MVDDIYKKVAPIRKNTFKFKGFHELLGSIHVDSLHREADLSLDPFNAHSFFQEELNRLKEENLTIEFTQLRDSLFPFTHSLALLLHRKKDVIKVIIDAIDKEKLASSAIKSRQDTHFPVLAAASVLIPAFARDIREEFVEVFPDVIHALIRNIRPSFPENVDCVFSCIAFMFKFLNRFLVVDIQQVITLHHSLLFHYSSHLSQFTASALSFLFRRIEVNEVSNNLKLLIENSLAIAQNDRHNLVSKAISNLLFESVKGVGFKLRTMSIPFVVQIIKCLSELIFPNIPSQPLSDGFTLISKISSDILSEWQTLLKKYLKTETCQVIWDSFERLFDELTSLESSKDPNKSFRIIQFGSIVSTWISNGKITDFSINFIIKMIDYIVHDFLSNTSIQQNILCRNAVLSIVSACFHSEKFASSQQHIIFSYVKQIHSHLIDSQINLIINNNKTEKIEKDSSSSSIKNETSGSIETAFEFAKKCLRRGTVGLLLIPYFIETCNKTVNYSSVKTLNFLVELFQALSNQEQVQEWSCVWKPLETPNHTISETIFQTIRNFLNPNFTDKESLEKLFIAIKVLTVVKITPSQSKEIISKISEIITHSQADFTESSLFICCECVKTKCFLISSQIEEEDVKVKEISQIINYCLDLLKRYPKHNWVLDTLRFSLFSYSQYNEITEKEISYETSKEVILLLSKNLYHPSFSIRSCSIAILSVLPKVSYENSNPESPDSIWNIPCDLFTECYRVYTLCEKLAGCDVTSITADVAQIMRKIQTASTYNHIPKLHRQPIINYLFGCLQIRLGSIWPSIIETIVTFAEHSEHDLWFVLCRHVLWFFGPLSIELNKQGKFSDSVDEAFVNELVSRNISSLWVHLPRNETQKTTAQADATKFHELIFQILEQTKSLTNKKKDFIITRFIPNSNYL
eukprot:c21054_g1_i5.p1 GENE.c21054_g1_i5~~c21054_g1_i5.p1  ORF type:complete len:979 (-),score=313.70 c21054_g1_i5:162-2912(-)